MYACTVYSQNWPPKQIAIASQILLNIRYFYLNIQEFIAGIIFIVDNPVLGFK